MKEKTESEKFKELILDMYRVFPNGRYRTIVEKVIKTEEDRNQLIDHGFLLKEETAKGEQFGLGPNALPLVTSWKIEELTNKIVVLTAIVVFLTMLTFVLAICK